MFRRFGAGIFQGMGKSIEVDEEGEDGG